MTTSEISTALRNAANPEKALVLARFFKTGKGEYGEGDRFLGVMVPVQRAIVRQYFARTPISKAGPSLPVTLSIVDELLQGTYHEERLTALLILVAQYKRCPEPDKERIFRFYLDHLTFINNWDLVDLSAPNIVGDYLVSRPPSPLYKLAKAPNLWARRVAILATLTFIRAGQFADTLALAEYLLVTRKDSQDLMHKAVGWMLREVGKRDQAVLEEFLGRFAAQLPRMALRYAIERFPESTRQHYLAMGKPARRA